MWTSAKALKAHFTMCLPGGWGDTAPTTWDKRAISLRQIFHRKGRYAVVTTHLSEPVCPEVNPAQTGPKRVL